MEKFSVAIIQTNQNKCINTNLEDGMKKCIIAKELGADLVLFPEMYSIGYWFPKNEKEIVKWKEQAITKKSEYINAFTSLAKNLEISIAITFLRKSNRKYYNSIMLIDQKGKAVINYDKIHTCSFGDEKLCNPGSKFKVCNLVTNKGTIKVGAMICFDREFPESARVLMIKGAEIILVPNACELENNRKMQICSRSFENMLGIVVANYAGNECMGHSIAYDGIAFSENGQSRDMKLFEANNDEGIYLVKFDMKKLQEYREHEVWGNSYRRPLKYTKLIFGKANYPFIRNNK